MMIEALIKYTGICKEIEKMTADMKTVVTARLNADGCLKAAIISDPIQSGITSDPTYRVTENLFLNFEEICLELTFLAESTKNELRRLLQTKKRIDKMLKKMDKKGLTSEKKFIEMRYFQQMSIKQLTTQFRCDRKTLWRMEKRVKVIVKELF